MEDIDILNDEEHDFKNWIEEQKDKATGLQIEVLEDLEDYKTKEEAISYLNDVLNQGCVSGIASGLIYYYDTNKFYDRNEEEIEDLIYQNQKDLGYKNRNEFIGSLNGIDDVGSLQQEKNLLSWFAYEETSRNILNILNPKD